jgi:hypothetical protein
MMPPKVNPKGGIMYDKVQDSGERTEFATGSVRDRRAGKGRFDLMSPIVAKRDAIHLENGALKYGDRNWEKGQPVMTYFDSARRHLESWLECILLGVPEDEDHLAAARWNIAGIIHTLVMIDKGMLPRELDNRPSPVEHFEPPVQESEVPEGQFNTCDTCGDYEKLPWDFPCAKCSALQSGRAAEIDFHCFWRPRPSFLEKNKGD